MTPTRRRHADSPDTAVRAAGFQPTPMVHDRGGRRWWGIGQDSTGRWTLLTVRDSTFDPADEDRWDAQDFVRRHPPVPPSAEVTDVILEILSRPRTTVIAAEFEPRAVNRYFDHLPAAERDQLEDLLTTQAPQGWARLQGLRCFDVNVAVRGRQAEAVGLLKTTLHRLWPQTMTAGRLTQFGKRHADETFMVHLYETWTEHADRYVKLVAADEHTTTGDTLRALVTQMSTLDDLA